MNEVVLRVEGLAKRFGQVQALSEVNFELKKGKLTVFLGENGAGKTTTLKIILGFLFPDAGLVKKFNEGLRLGYVPEQPSFFPWLKGREILYLTASLFGLTEEELDKKVTQAASLLAFDVSQLDRRVRTYSHGNQKKMSYLQNLIIEPDLLIVDEPFTALDPVAIKQVRDLLSRLKEEGKTVLLSSHLISEAEKLADEVVIIKKGRTIGQVNWPEFKQKQIYLKARRGTASEKIILETWPQGRIFEDRLENFVLRKEWEERLSGLESQLRQVLLQEVEMSEPDLESFFLFLTGK